MKSARVNTFLVVCLAAALLAGPVSPGLASTKRPATKTTHKRAAKATKRRKKRPAPRCHRTKHHRCPKRKPRRSSVARIVPPSGNTGVALAPIGGTARLTATINPNGHFTVYWFQYGPTTGYGTQTAALPAGSGKRPMAVSIPVSNLTPLSAYHFRIVASNCGDCRTGTVYGGDAAFSVGGYRNPVFGPAEAADPDILDNGGLHDDYWAYTTGDRFPILHSSDLVHWAPAGLAMAGLPAWVVQSGDWHPWAPSVVQVRAACPGTGSTSCYVMYYVGLSAQWQANCVAVATSPVPGGPFTDQGPLSNGTLDAVGRPIGCGDNNGFGMIDPSPFVDPTTNQVYLYASEDFACPPGSTSCTQANAHLQPTVSVIPLTADFLHAAGPRTPLFSGASGTWEDAGAPVPTVEGPFAVLHNGLYYLVYSGGSWRAAYGMGYATASTPTGPFTKAGGPLVGQTADVLSPGGGDTPVQGPNGGLWLAYHGRAGSYANPRTLRLDPFGWRTQAGAPDAPVIGGPTSVAQPAVP